MLVSGVQIYFVPAAEAQKSQYCYKLTAVAPMPQITFLGKIPARTQDEARQHLSTNGSLPFWLNSFSYFPQAAERATIDGD